MFSTYSWLFKILSESIYKEQLCHSVFLFLFVKAHFVYDLEVSVLGLGYLQISLTHLILENLKMNLFLVLVSGWSYTVTFFFGGGVLLSDYTS